MLLRNAARCRHCGTVIESKYRHDFRSHSCKTADGREVYFYIDGGLSYQRGGGDFAAMEDLSEYPPDTSSESRNAG